MRKFRTSIILFTILLPLMVNSAVTVTVNGSNHTIPQTNERGWGSAVTAWIQAISANTFQPTAGSFSLTADADFGSSYGLKSSYLSSRSANPAASGLVRLSNNQGISWRNAANNADLTLKVDGSNNLNFDGATLSVGGTPVQTEITVSDTSTLDLTLAADDISGAIVANSLINSHISPSAGISYSKLDLSNSIVNADISSSAAIGYSKLNLGTSIVNGDISNSAAIGYSKLNLTGGIVNADISNSAAIGYSKLNLSGGIVNADISSSAAIAASKLVGTDISTVGTITSGTWSGTAIAINKGGTGQTTANAAFNALAPSQTSNSGKVLTTDGTNTSWVSAPSPAQVIQSKTANYTALVTDDVIYANTNAFTITMYAASAASKPLRVCKVGTDTNLITIARAGSDTFVVAGGSVNSTVLHRAGECLTITSDGTSKFFLDENERTERVKTGVCGSTPCTITSQSGAWVTSITRSGTGAYAVNFNSGIFSSPPSCTCGSDGTNYHYCDPTPQTTTTAKVDVRTVHTGDAPEDGSLDVICRGAR